VGWVDDKVGEKLGHIATAIEADGEKTRLAFAQAMADSMRGIRIDGALPRTLFANAQVYVAGGRLVGWSVRANGGEVILDLYDGTAADPNRYLGAIDLASGASQTVWMGPGGVSFVDGLYVAASGAGTPLGSVWIGAVD
jgi:hypothetical protein